MEQPALRLKEIIWEITLFCKNGCTYCGSKTGQLKYVPIPARILAIAKEIAKYPPEEIDISGGDPLEVSLDIHQQVVKILHDGGVKRVKLVMNPRSVKKFTERNGFTSSTALFDLYDWIGISINDERDIEAAKDIGLPHNKSTVITNFGVHNVFAYDAIEAMLGNRLWQVQFTMTENDPLYKSPTAVKFLFDKMRVSMGKGKEIIPADNMNGGVCGAGRNVLGVLHDGRLLPCLSMKSWRKELPRCGNLLETPLKELWEKGFSEYRFGSYKCCKDICGRQEFTCTPVKPSGVSYPPDTEVNPVYAVRPRSPLDRDTVVMYGTFPRDGIYAYAVFPTPPWGQTGSLGTSADSGKS